MELNNNGLFCDSLSSKAQPDIGLILVTGATGYIGGYLVCELISRGYKVRVMVRKSSRNIGDNWAGIEVVEADVMNYEELESVFEGVNTAYYLIHSMILGERKFEKADIKAADNFQRAAEKKNVKRIIYLGGLGDEQSSLSPHLQSRNNVGIELNKGKVPITILRAAIIIGSGSASYEIIRHLVKTLPIFVVPSWGKTKCQPIALQDVIKYLIGVLEVKETSGKSFDIGGEEIISYKKILNLQAEVLGKRRYFIFFQYTNIKIYSFFTSFLTPVPAPIIQGLMRSLKNNVVCINNDIREYLPFELLSYKIAMLKVMSREEQDSVYTKWKYTSPAAHELALKLHEINGFSNYSNSFTILTNKSRKSLFHSICEVEGEDGWFRHNWIWRIGYIIDRTLKGVFSPPKKTYTALKVNDIIEFWRVEDIVPDKRLLLRSKMLLPGKAWLEFRVDENDSKNCLSIKTYYYTSNLIGKIYWYLFLPFHNLIFFNLIKSIEKRS